MDDFADYIKSKRMEKGYTLRTFASLVGIAPSYLSDIEKKKRNAPSSDILNKMVEVLNLNIEESNKLYDLASKANDSSVADDVINYVSNFDTVKVALRKARDLNFGDKEWIKIIEQMEKNKK